MLNTFSKPLILSAIIVFIFSLIIYTIDLNNIIKLEKNNFPPVIGKCPDYWNLLKDNNNIEYCKVKKYDNDKYINRGNWGYLKFIPFNDDCYNYQWSKYNNITWDGLSNNNDDCVNVYYNYEINDYSKYKLQDLSLVIISKD